jgi:hypothetical protein
MPAVGYGRTGPAAQAPFSGGGSSGGYRVQVNGPDNPNRTPLLIGIGVIAVVLAIVLVVLLSGGDDNSGGGGTTTSQGTAASTTQQAAGYTGAVRDQFVTACTTNGGTDARCGCVFDNIKANVDFSDFKAYDEQLGNDPETPAPSWLDSAVQAC